MTKKLLSREEAPFAPLSEKTFGLSIVKEVWETEEGEKTYWKYSLPNTVQIFGVTTKGQIIAISEFQPGVGTEYIHLPGETMEQGETPIEAAIRGLLEETGYKADSTKLLSSILENSGRSDRLVYIVLALNCEKIERETEKGIKTVLLSPNEFWTRLMQYFATNPDYKHGGGNTLKATVLAFNAFNQLGFRLPFSF